VAKTGGAAIQTFLRSEAKDKSITTQYHDGDFTGPEDWNRDACIVFGHRPVGWALGFDELKPVYVVTVREPVSFTVSLFDYISQHTFRVHAPLRASFGNLTLSGNVLARNPDVLAFVRDKQSELLLGVRGCREQEPTATCAVRHLRSVDCVAVTDKLDDLLLQLRWRTGWLGVGHVAFPPVNRAPGEARSALLPKARRALEAEAKDGADLAVYRVAQVLHEEKTARALNCLSISSARKKVIQQDARAGAPGQAT
jgi:hypothetical protein